MGSATSNALLKEKAQILEQMLDGQIELTKIQSAVALANEIDKQKTQTLNADQQKALLVRDLFQRVPAGINATKPLSAPHQKAMIIAQLYFDERRFIEAGHQLSRLLDEAPQYPGARNLLARCFFFLGNQDRTVQELSFVLEQKETQEREILDALFLLGAAVLESQTPSKDSLKKGVAAWEAYIQQAPNSPQIPTITKGLAVMKKALEMPEGIQPNSRRALLPENASEEDDGQDAVAVRGHVDDGRLLRDKAALARDDTLSDPLRGRGGGAKDRPGVLGAIDRHWRGGNGGMGPWLGWRPPHCWCGWSGLGWVWHLDLSRLGKGKAIAHRGPE